MRTFALSGTLALALAAVPVTLIAQDASTQTATPAPPMTATDSAMTAEQQSAYDGWPADQRSGFDSWPADYKSYYWTLSPSQQAGYWRLTNEQRTAIAGMTPEQRTTTWTSIEQQMAGGPAPAPAAGATTATAEAEAPMAPQASADATTMGNMTPPPETAMNKSYPLCSKTLKDSCINPREAGKNYGNRPI